MEHFSITHISRNSCFDVLYNCRCSSCLFNQAVSASILLYILNTSPTDLTLACLEWNRLKVDIILKYMRASSSRKITNWDNRFHAKSFPCCTHKLPFSHVPVIGGSYSFFGSTHFPHSSFVSSSCIYGYSKYWAANVDRKPQKQ